MPVYQCALWAFKDWQGKGMLIAEAQTQQIKPCVKLEPLKTKHHTGITAELTLLKAKTITAHSTVIATLQKQLKAENNTNQALFTQH